MSPMADEEKRYYHRGIGDREPFSASPKQSMNVESSHKLDSSKPSSVVSSTHEDNEERRMREEIQRLKMHLEAMKTQEAEVRSLRRLVDQYQSTFGFGDSGEVAARYGMESYNSPVSNLKKVETQKKVRAALIRGIRRSSTKTRVAIEPPTNMYEYSGEPKWGAPKNKDLNL
jgi:hypothetical protein